MKAIKRITALALCALMLLGLLSGCGEKKQGDEKFVLNVSVCNVIDSLDPAMNIDADADSVFYALYENLMRESDDGSGEVTLTNGMAKEYTEETNYDGSVTYRFTLRSTARWSDGEKVTADDFVYAWQRLADPATDSPNHALMSVVAGYDDVRETGDKTKLQVSAKDESTFVVTLSAPCAYFIEGICTAVATMPLRRDLTENGGGFDTPDLVSNGAYHVSAWTKSSELTAARSDEYYEARLVGPDELHFIFTAGADEAWQLYEAGDIDYIAHLPNSVIAELSQDESWKPTAVYATASVLYNNESDTFSNEHIRKAFDLAIDRAAATAAGGAENSPATGLVPYGIPDSGETEDDFRTTGGELCAIDEEGMSARATQAQEELTYAGYYSTSMFPPVELLYVTGTENDAVASALQSMWSTTLGVNVMLRGVTQAEYNARMEAGNYELALQKVTALYDDAMGFLDRWCSEDEQNLIGYENGTYDVLMGVARASEDPVARTAFLHDAETMLLGETALSPVYFDGTATATSPVCARTQTELCETKQNGSFCPKKLPFFLTLTGNLQNSACFLRTNRLQYEPWAALFARTFSVVKV